MPDLPRITLLTPCFNSERFIERTLRSVLDQGYPNLEYMVLDAGSTDGSTAIIRDYQNSLRWWRSYPDRGYASALNEGFSRATGSVFSFINSDDVLLPGSLHAVGQAFAKSGSTKLTFGKCLMIDGEDSINYRVCGVRPTFQSMLLWSMAGFTQPGTFFHREVFDRVGAFNEELKLAADFDFFLRALRYYKAQKIDQYLSAYRVHDSSITGSRLGELMAESDCVRQRYGLAKYSRASRSVLRAAYWSRYKMVSGWYKARHAIARTEHVAGFKEGHSA